LQIGIKFDLIAKSQFLSEIKFAKKGEKMINISVIKSKDLEVLEESHKSN
jgi:hypothetical protein